MTWKAHSFSALKRIWGQFHEFKNFDALKCDLAKTCCAWPEKSVLYNFHGKRTVFQFWRKFEGSFTILRTLALKNQIWQKRAAHDLKSGFCTIFFESALFFYFAENFRPVSRFWKLCRSKCDFAKTCCAWPEKSVLYNFHGRRTVFSFSREFQARVTIFRTLTLQNAIWPKPTAHDLKRAFCTIFMKSALFFRFKENLRPVSRLWELWRSKMRFGQNVLRMTWKERFVTFSWKVHCFPVLTRISGEGDDFKNFDAQKCNLAKKCCAWPEKSVLDNFNEKRTVFPIWREFQASATILRTLTLKNAHGFFLLKKCTWPEKRTLFPLWREFEASFTSSKTLTL